MLSICRHSRVSLILAASSLSLACFGQVVGGHWHQTWAADFNTGASDLNNWSYDLGNGGPSLPGWGNGESEYYTSDSRNVNVAGGNLNISAIYDGSRYTSARIKSNHLFSQAYGLFEFRAKLPTGQGLWPAVWMMPEDSAYGGWPTSGEIDILESKGQSSTLVQGTLHSGPIWYQDHQQTQTFAGSGLMPGGFSTHDWHTYDIEWSKGTAGQAGYFKWYVDGILYETQHGGWYVPGGAGPDAPFDKPFYFILNMAVGGGYVGSPNLQANQAYTMQVDYVHAYTATPEPASLAFLGIGAASLLRKRKRASRI